MSGIPEGYVSIEAAELERLRAIDQKYGWRERPPPDHRHPYKPHRKYPWFCDSCGYAEHDPLMHYPRQGEQR